jgi:hypothetical protein
MYNSSNAILSMANTPVAIGLDRSQSFTPRRGRGFRGNSNRFRENIAQIDWQSNVAQSSGQNNTCYQCDVEGHYTCNCPQK